MTKRNKIIYWIATLWLCLGMLSTALVQLVKAKDGTGGLTDITHLGYPVYFLSLIAIPKIAGVIVLLIPNARLLKEWAYAGFFFIMSGAVYSHIASGDSVAQLLPALLLLALTLISWYVRPANRTLVLHNQ